MRILGHATDIRKEARMLSTPSCNLAQGKGKVQSAAQAAAVVNQEAETLLKTFDVSGNGLSREEQHHRKATHDKLSDDLQDAWKGLQAAIEEYESAETDHASTQAALGASFTAVSDSPGAAPQTRTGSNRIELESRDAEFTDEAGRQAALAATARDLDVTASEVNQHTAITQEYADEVRTIAQDIQTLQSCMVSLADLAQEQGETLENIESNFSRAAQSTADGEQELLQTSRNYRSRTKWQCWVLLIAIVLSIVLIIVLATKK